LGGIEAALIVHPLSRKTVAVVRGAARNLSGISGKYTLPASQYAGGIRNTPSALALLRHQHDQEVRSSTFRQPSAIERLKQQGVTPLETGELLQFHIADPDEYPILIFSMDNR
jgi:hypothetical protein